MGATMEGEKTADPKAPESVPPVRLFYKRERKTARAPVRATNDSCGYDLCSCEDAIVPPRSGAVISTGLSFAFPSGYYGRVAPRSGLAAKFLIDVGAGVVDPGYRGEVKVVLFNLSDHNFNVREGDRIAQLILESYSAPPTAEVESHAATERGDRGFGSTGGTSQQRTMLDWVKKPEAGPSSCSRSPSSSSC